ncbi:DnaJ domain-containing protein [Halomarina oriensis]|uniref:J domain-containing protein n=1 Tax=Halomarina oriensis TaxID=671145 RepID=UPI0034A4312C
MNTVVVALPNWLFLGVLIGVALSVLVAGTFVVGGRLFPDPPIRPGRGEDTESRRRTEIREYLTHIDEPFAERHFVEGHTVDFYLPKRDVAITFDARTFLAIDTDAGGRTDAVLVEHELPGVGLGGRLPFETPQVGFDDEGGDGEYGLAGRPDPNPAAFAHLGLSTNASEDEVRQAYRQRVKTVHPDQGGDPEAFRQLQEAYAAAREQAA